MVTAMATREVAASCLRPRGSGKRMLMALSETFTTSADLVKAVE
jgi:hypothetical protein